MFGALILFRAPLAKAAGGVFNLFDQYSNPENTTGARVATSTLNYLLIGQGTTTITAATLGTDQIDLNVFGVASSTLSHLRWRYEFSHSTTSVVTDQVWFPEPAELTINATTTTITRTAKEYSYLFASSTAHRLATSTAMNGVFDQDTTFSFVFRIKDIAARWTRVVFYNPTGATTANDARMDTAAESTALGTLPVATSTGIAIQVFVTQKQPY